MVRSRCTSLAISGRVAPKQNVRNCLLKGMFAAFDPTSWIPSNATIDDRIRCHREMGCKAVQEKVAWIVTLPTVPKLPPRNTSLHTKSNRRSRTWLLLPFSRLPIFPAIITTQHLLTTQTWPAHSQQKAFNFRRLLCHNSSAFFVRLRSTSNAFMPSRWPFLHDRLRYHDINFFVIHSFISLKIGIFFVLRRATSQLLGSNLEKESCVCLVFTSSSSILLYT